MFGLFHPVGEVNELETILQTAETRWENTEVLVGTVVKI